MMQIQSSVLSSIEIITEASEIMKMLKFGTNLPVKTEILPYLRRELKALNVSTLIIRDQEQVLGHSIFYKYEDTMYFGFFKAFEDREDIIKMMIIILEKIAKDQKCIAIQGPVNLPPYVFGWGFSEYNSDPSISCATPHTDPKYIDIFNNYGFFSKHRLLWFRIPFHPVPYKPNPQAKVGDFNNIRWIKPFFKLQMELFPDSARLTPNRNMELALDSLKFIKEFGYEECIYRAYNAEELVGLGYSMPNIFDLNDEGKCKSLLLMGAAIKKKVQKTGVLSGLFTLFLHNANKLGFTHGEWVVGDDNSPSIKAAESFGGKLVRSYQILEMKL